MNIVVCIKQVPDTAEVKINPETNTLIRDGVENIMNPFDRQALETALILKDTSGAKVTVVSMGPPQATDILKEAIAMGADDAVLISDRALAGSDTLATSVALAAAVRKVGECDLVLCGKQAIDGDTAQVGPEIAEFLNIPHVTNVTKIIEVGEKSIVVETDLPTTLEVCEISYPCLLTVEKDIFQPRLPSFKLKMATKDNEIPMITLKDMDDTDEKHYGLNGSATQVIRIFPPEPNTDKDIVRGNSDELTETLFNKIVDLKIL